MDAPPEDDGDTWLRPDRRLLTVRRLLAIALVTLPLLVASIVLALVVGIREGAAGLVITAVLTLQLQLAVRRRFAAWGYLERADDLLVRRGVLFSRLSVVPYGRMQYVDVTAGPLDRKLGLATVTLHTAAAATDASVPGLRAAEAERLRDRLAALGQARQAGV